MEAHDMFRAYDIEWQGRIERFELPTPLVTEDREYRAATVREGVSTRFLRAMRQLPAEDGHDDSYTDALLDEAHTQIHPLLHEQAAAEVEALYGGIRQGDVAIRDISLIPE